MLGDPRLGQSAAVLDRPQRIAAAELVLRRGRRLEVAARDHAFGEVVEPLEPVAARHDDLTRGEEVLECALGRLPVPHLAGHRAFPLEGARRQRAALADRLEDVCLGLGILSLAAPPVPVPELLHAALEERIVLDRQHARLVGPVLEDPSGRQEPCHGPDGIAAEPRAERQPVGAVDGRDRVELHAAEARDRRGHVGRPSRPRARGVALVRDDVATELRDGDGLHDALNAGAADGLPGGEVAEGVAEAACRRGRPRAAPARLRARRPRADAAS